jgi:hypothetical protein
MPSRSRASQTGAQTATHTAERADMREEATRQPPRPEPAPLKLANYTTVVEWERSLAEIKTLLRRAGAREITEAWDDDGNTVGIRFALGAGSATLEYRLPVRVERVWQRLQREHAARLLPGLTRAEVTQQQARHIAWRTLHLWLIAQLDLIASGAGDQAEVLLPCQLFDPGELGRITFYEAGLRQGLLPPPAP